MQLIVPEPQRFVHFWPAEKTAEIAAHFAKVYESGRHQPLSDIDLETLRSVTHTWFDRIPVKPEWCCVVEPYNSLDEMAADVERGHFRMCDYDRFFRSQVFGPCYKFFRAVHDYYGHYLGANPFGLIGELSSYGIHCAMFPPETHCAIWNELIHVNSYKENFNKLPNFDKLVRLPPLTN